MKTKVTKDGFIWLVVPSDDAMEMWKSKTAELYILHNDDSETMVETDLQVQRATFSGKQIGIEVGFIKDLLPVCPKCGKRLVPSDNPEYVWQCYECDEDFYSFEVCNGDQNQ